MQDRPFNARLSARRPAAAQGSCRTPNDTSSASREPLDQLDLTGSEPDSSVVPGCRRVPGQDTNAQDLGTRPTGHSLCLVKECAADATAPVPG